MPNYITSGTTYHVLSCTQSNTSFVYSILLATHYDKVANLHV